MNEKAIAENKQYTPAGLQLIAEYLRNSNAHDKPVNFFDRSDNVLVDDKWRQEYHAGNRSRFIVAIELHEIEGCLEAGRGNNRTWTWSNQCITEHVIVVRDFFQNNLVWKTHVNGGISRDECRRITKEFGFECYLEDCS